MKVDNREITITGRLIKTARIKEEWYEDLEDPAIFIKNLKQSKVKADFFTFWQRLPETEPKYDYYYMEWDNIAALPIVSFDHWWNKQINAKARNKVRKAQKKGVDVKLAGFDDEFIKGMMSIFNESPIRQGKPFWHYGKNNVTVKREFSRNIHREDLIGAYYNGDLIGFIMLAYAGKYAMATQIISKIEHRDKAPTNALIAKVVEILEEQNIPYLIYAKWTDGTLGDFKRYNGFEKIGLPRYYIPLTIKGVMILKLKLHRGLGGILPERLIDFLKNLRKNWFAIKYSLRNA